MHSRDNNSSRRITGTTASVLLPLPLGRTYDYGIPPEWELRAGQYVRVPLGKREALGVVWGPGTGDVDPARIKDVLEVIAAPPQTEELQKLIDWVASYTLTPPGAVLRMAMSVQDALFPDPPVTAYRLAPPKPGPEGEGGGKEPRMTDARRRILRVLAGGKVLRPVEIARRAAVSPGVVKGLLDAGLVEAVDLSAEAPPPRPDPAHGRVRLSPAQEEAAADLRAKIGAGFSVTLLDGVTGSGKTEVYFEAIATALNAGRQALVMVPEIALTTQWLERFERRFKSPPAVWHSDLTGVQRRRTWRAIASGDAPVIVGARSALFLPYPDLGLIVVDEEHDPSYKQEDGVIYNARDMAVVRANLSAGPIVLVSATPSLETVVNCWQGRYAQLALPERHAGAAEPDIRAIDMRSEKMPRQSWLSPTLRAELTATMEAGEQALLFLNRRGYAPLTLCRTCGHRLQCPQCTAWLVEHRLAGRLQCHHCGFSAIPSNQCPECGAADSFAACGPGVERLAEEVAGLFPEARVALVASDNIRSPSAAAELIRRIQDHAIDILIGTQIVAKGHHFPMLTLVGVVDADLGLAGGDLRAFERTYQLLHQVSGRAGRAERPGKVMLQTYSPDHPVMRALVSGQRDRFMKAEAESRRDAGMPPFGRLAALVVSGPDEGAVDAIAKALGRAAPHGNGVEVFGPAPAPLSILRGRHRRRLLLKAQKQVNVQDVVAKWLAKVPVKGSTRVQVDIDPYSFM